MAEPSYNYSYTPTVDHRESNLYREEYYSSTDTEIYFDGDKQTEIGFIQYEIQEQLKPIYGYNSRTFDDVVIGNRIVVGQFTVPIKNKAKQEWQKEDFVSRNTASNSIDDYNNNENSKLYNTEWFGSTARNINKHNNGNIDADYLVKLIALGYDVNTNSSYQQYQKAIKQYQADSEISVTGELNNNTKNNIDEDFEKLDKQEINLDGGTGYSDITLKKGQTKLSGKGLILNTMPTDTGNVYRILDSKGNIYYWKGDII